MTHPLPRTRSSSPAQDLAVCRGLGSAPWSSAPWSSAPWSSAPWSSAPGPPGSGSSGSGSSGSGSTTARRAPALLALALACLATAVLQGCGSGDVDPGDWQVASDEQTAPPSGRRARGGVPAPPPLDGIYRFEATVAGEHVVRELVVEGDQLTRRIDGHVVGVQRCTFTPGPLDAVDAACVDADGVTTQLPLVRAGDGLAHRADTAMIYRRVADLAPPEQDERPPTVSGDPTSEE